MEISNILKFGLYQAYIERDYFHSKTPKFTKKYDVPDGVFGNPYLSYKFSSF